MFVCSHTTEIEVFHSLRAVVYVQKVYSKNFASMECLSYLAAIDHNHNVHRKYISNADGSYKCKRKHNRRNNSFYVEGVREQKDYGYVCMLLVQSAYKCYNKKNTPHEFFSLIVSIFVFVLLSLTAMYFYTIFVLVLVLLPWAIFVFVSAQFLLNFRSIFAVV
jgi:hypothetical protein